jgi:8-amino-7-oxononanoate synthase
MKSLQPHLDDLRLNQLYRQRQVVQGGQGVEVQIDGRTLLSFCSNDYLDLAHHPEVVAAFIEGARRHGVGAGASHLITGHHAAHHALEEELADFAGTQRALLFSTGYMANLGVTSALMQRHGSVFEDKLNHASLIDAARLCGARVRRYAHGDTDRLTALLAAARSEKLILSDGVFSMDGDVAPLPALLDAARTQGAWLLLDDAHGLGVLGAHGRGTFEHFALPVASPAILMGTLGKALGTFGAFVAGSEDLIETLIQHARTYIYTTALPPAVAEATRASLRVLRTDDGRRAALHARIRQFRDGARQLGLDLPASETAIQPVILGAPGLALAASEALRARGILVSAIRPPTVPRDTARLRITLSAGHTPQQVERLLDALAQLPRAEVEA